MVLVSYSPRNRAKKPANGLPKALRNGLSAYAVKVAVGLFKSKTFWTKAKIHSLKF